MVSFHRSSRPSEDQLGTAHRQSSHNAEILRSRGPPQRPYHPSESRQTSSTSYAPHITGTAHFTMGFRRSKMITATAAAAAAMTPIPTTRPGVHAAVLEGAGGGHGRYD